jgi:hypothetical protein
MTKDTAYAMVAGFMIFAILNTMPFADAEKYRRAKETCEKTLPRNQQCKVIGVPE